MSTPGDSAPQPFLPSVQHHGFRFKVQGGFICLEVYDCAGVMFHVGQVQGSEC